MRLSIIPINSIPRGEYLESIGKLFPDAGSNSNACEFPKLVMIEDLFVNIMIYEKSINFNMYRYNEEQEKLVKYCINTIFKNRDIAYQCDSICNWFNKYKKVNAIRLPKQYLKGW